MRIRLNSTWLAAGDLEGPGALRVGGAQVVQEAQLFRALAAAWFARGNHSQTVSFSVTRAHNTVEDAEWFILTHYAALPKEGDLVFVIGTGAGERAVMLEDAVLQGAPEIRNEGSTTFTTYNLAGGLLTNTEPPDIDPYDDVIRTLTIPIPAATKRVTVNFTTSLPTSPRSITCAVLKADDSKPNITFITVEKDSISTAGFIAVLSATTPDDTYELSYQAFA